MSRNNKNKLVVLLLCYLLPAALLAGQTWIGVSSHSPVGSKITSLGISIVSTEITVEIPGFYLTDITSEGKNVKLPQLIDGHPMLEKGCPELQKMSFTLQLPANGVTEMTVVSSKYVDYTDIDILPSAGDDSRNGNSPTYSKGQIYQMDSFYPGYLVGSAQPFIARNQRAQAFQVFPFQYNPVTHVLRFYYQIVFNAVNTGTEGQNPLMEKDNRIKPVDGLSIDFINPKVSTLKSGNLPYDKGSLLIICPEIFRKAVEPLAKWRIETGIQTEIVGSEQFADAQALYEFVKNYYYTHPTMAYLLLIGDANQVPTFALPYGSSDNSYSYLAGNDHYPDILVGRFSAETISDVQVQVNRTLQYEKEPAAGAWLETATGIGSTLSPGDDGESDYQHIRNLLKTINATSYTQYNEFFDGSQGEGDASGNPATSEIVKKINDGTGAIFYAGHGSPTSWATGSFTHNEIEKLNNFGKYPLIWSAACENGNFAGKNCLAESWLRAANGNGQPIGAIATLMASGSQTSYPPMQAQDKIAEILSNPQEGLETMGAISIKGMMSMNDIYGQAGYATTDTWILFGDPALQVRTSAPKQLIINHKGAIGAKKLSFSFTSETAHGFACLSQDGIILGTSRVTEGTNTIYLDYPASGETCTLTITALNYLPYMATIQVIQKPGIAAQSLPVNHSRLQPINTGFSWESGDGGNPDYYLFYLGTDNPPTNLVNGEKLTEAKYKAGFNFDYNTTYYWKVVSVNAFGSIQSRVMDFKTVFGPDEDFEPVFKTSLAWNQSGMNNWGNDVSEYFEGTHSIRSGQINNNEFSSMAYPCEVSTCDFVSFWSKTSSETDDKLQFLVDGSVLGEWSGLTDWSFHIYKIEAGMHQLEWRYSKNAQGQAGKDAAWLDNIHLPVHKQASAQVATTGSVCEKSVFETSASAKDCFSVQWLSEGDGSFDDVNLENAVYTPGASDIANGFTNLHMQVNAYEGCLDVYKNLTLAINPLPAILLPSDTIISTGNSIELDASLPGNMTYLWQPDGSSSSSVIIDSMFSSNGIKTAKVTVTSAEGCAATKEIKVHFNNQKIEDTYSIFPNPSNGNFTLKPTNGSAEINSMSLIDKSGKMVWKNEERIDVIGSQQISIAGLQGGAYVLVTENTKGRVSNIVVIK